MKNEKFEHLLSTIRNEKLDEKVVAQARDRVWKSMLDANPAATQARPHTLRCCEDFQSLIPAYVAKQLAPARVMLFEDHVHACVACRHALERARDGERRQVWKIDTRRSGSRVWAWTMGAVAVAAVVIVALAFTYDVLPGQNAVRAEVQTVDGSLYSVDGDNVRLIPTGYKIRSRDEIRTAKGSTAVVRLDDGSLVEIGPRADLSVSRQWGGTRFTWPADR